MEIISKEEFESIFRYHHWGDVDQFAKNELFDFFVSLKLTEKDVRKILNGAKKMAIAVNKQGYVGFNEVKTLIAKHGKDRDMQIFNQFDAIDRKLKEYYLEAADFADYEINVSKLDLLLKDCLQKAKQITDKENKNTQNFAKAVMDNFWMLASIYSALSRHLPLEDGEVNGQHFMRIADGIMMEILNKLDPAMFEDFKSKLEKKSGGISGAKQSFQFGSNLAFQQIDEMLTALTMPNNQFAGFKHGETLTEKEIKKLIEHTRSIILTSNRDKVFGAIRVLRKHIEEVNKKYSNKFNINIKDIFLGAGSILNINSSTLQDTSNLLLGKTVSQLNSGKESNAFLRYVFPNMRIVGIEEETTQHAILESRRTIFLELTTSSLVKATSSIVNCLFEALVTDKTNSEGLIEKIDKLEELGIDFETIFTKDNIFDIASSASFKSGKASSTTGAKVQENFIENIKILNGIVNINDLQKTIHHNIKLLLDSPLALKEKLAEIYVKLAKTKDAEAYRQDIEQLLNISVSAANGAAGKPTGAKRTYTRVVRKRQKIEIEQAFIDENLLKEFGISYKHKKQEKAQPKIEAKHPKRENLDKIVNIIEDVEQGKTLDQVSPEETFFSEYSALSEEISAIFSYYDLITSSSQSVMYTNRNLQAGEDNSIIKEIAHLSNANTPLKLSKIKKQIALINNLFANTENIESADVVAIVDILKNAIVKIDEITSLFEMEKEGLVNEEKLLLKTIKLNKKQSKEHYSGYIQELIDGPIAKLAKDIEKRMGKKEAEKFLKEYSKEYLAERDLAKEREEQIREYRKTHKQRDNSKSISYSGEEADSLSNNASLSAQIYALTLLKEALTQKQQQLSGHIGTAEEKQAKEKQNLIVKLLERCKALTETKSLLEKKIESLSASIKKKREFYDLKYKTKDAQRSSYAVRTMGKIESMAKELTQAQEELKQTDADYNKIQQEIKNLDEN